MRALVVLLLFTTLAGAQTVEEIADQASRPNTSPRERLDLMQRLMKLEGGPAALARVALDKARDPAVVHAAVDTLLEEGLGVAHLPRICALLLEERHRAQVEERLYRYAQEHPVEARELVTQLGHLAREPKGEPEAALDGQLAAVRALGKIPLRKAVEVIALVWSSSEGALAARCDMELKDVLEASTGEEALRLLAERGFASYTDLVKEVSRKRAERVRKLRKMVETLLKKTLETATAEQVFQFFTEADPAVKPYAAARARELAAAKQYGPKGAEHFATEVVKCLLKELPRGPNLTCVRLVETLKELYSTQALSKSGMPKAAEIRDALRVGSRGGADEAAFATLAISLLSNMGAGAAEVVAEYATAHEDIKVRVAAVPALGELASRGDQAVKGQVGALLAKLLQSNPPAPVLGPILFSLRAAPSDAAVASIQKLLFPSDPKRALERANIVNCIELLAANPSAAALATLERLAREAGDVKLRLDAVNRGLVARTYGGAESAGILKFLEELVLDAKQPEELRLGVIEALGAKGSATASGLLGALASQTDDKLDAKLRAAATEQRLALAKRLVRRNGQVTDDLLATVAVILSTERARPGADLGSMLAIARSAVQMADRKKVKARGCRGLYAQLLAAQPKPNAAEVRAAWKDASEKAAGDGLTSAQQIEVLKEYRTLLLATKPDKDGARVLFEETMLTNLRLLDLAKQTGDVQGSIRSWLEALDGAVVKLKDRKQADAVVGKRPQGELAGDLAERWEKLSKLHRQLPKAG